MKSELPASHESSPRRWTCGLPFVATEADCNVTRWSCAGPGERFRCFKCGHKFVPGDTVRWQFTNDTPGASGNPFVCVNCDGPKEKIVADIIALRAAAWWLR
jgi:hypothetical protein